MPAIEVHGLSKAFRTYKKEQGLRGSLLGLFRRRLEETWAVRDISFQIEAGERVGFLGPNGAGKTTTLKMLAGLLHPTAGEARVLNHTPWLREDGYRRQFALLLGQKNQLWWDLPARESIELNARIYDLPAQQWKPRAESMADRLGVKDKLDVAVRELSLGERTKLELIAALLHQPKVLFLDEPTLGLDVVSQKTVRDFLREENSQRGTTILLTSHYMADIQALCQRVIIIDHGKISFDGQLSEVVDRFADHKLVTIQFATSETDLPHRDTLATYGEVVEQTDALVKLRVKRDRVIPVCKTLLDKLPVKDIDIEEVPIEDIIRQLFDRKN
ncbi:MAG: ATP-binding cassette domain-containing protein [Pedosphaera sp.]|nr:ATP-binding cassette domain-containing protein [Pedosphaera sp.]